jgi:lysophospholipid acyltransferase (LPLAT)-like uncharacterized protein
LLRRYVLPPLIAVFYWIWARTWRLQVLEHPAFKEALKKGGVAFAHWHGDEMVVLRLGRHYKCAAMTSTSKDGELMTQVLKFFGFGISRGSSTRGGARALIGIIKLVKGGYNASVAVDGPKGPRHKVKEGVFYLSKHANVPIIPTGVAKAHALVFNRSWNKTFLPWPFSKVVVSFGKPILPTVDVSTETLPPMRENLELSLHLERGVAQAKLLGGPHELTH